MFQMKDEMQTAVKHNIRGGDGSPSFRYLFSAEQLGNRAEMMAVITLRPGESVGVHPHETNGEAYYILEGAATVTEDGESRELHVGDAEFCADGHTHSIQPHRFRHALPGRDRPKPVDRLRTRKEAPQAAGPLFREDLIDAPARERLGFPAGDGVRCVYSTVTVPFGPMVTVMPSLT